MSASPLRLTSFAHGGGCGCKIAPGILASILRSADETGQSNLLVGYASRDDAAVLDTGESHALVSTVDFFMPIVDDAVDFGRIAAANAISDVYAMGGTPLLAVAVLGWPVRTLPVDAARCVLDGARRMCALAGIPLAGGHSIDNPEPVFGLAVTGRVRPEHLKRNSTARAGCMLFLTKPLGVGMVTTAAKRGQALPGDLAEAVKWMTRLNSAGETFGRLAGVQAMTDVTGFGLLGHLIEMCEGSRLSARIELDRVPTLRNVAHYVAHRIHPDGTRRNWESYAAKTRGATADAQLVLADPQTNGGLLVAVEASATDAFRDTLRALDLPCHTFGRLVPPEAATISIV